MRPVLFVVTYPPELSAIPGSLRDAEGVATGVVGVGVVAASAGTASLLRRIEPRAVLLAGTAGVYPGSRIRVGDACVATAVRLVDAASVLGKAAFPRRVRTRLGSSPSWTRKLRSAGARPARTATALGITTDDGLAEALARRSGADLEHLEAFGVAAVCARSRVPFAALLGVANVVGQSGRSQWRRGEARAIASVRRILARSMRGKPGLL